MCKLAHALVFCFHNFSCVSLIYIYIVVLYNIFLLTYSIYVYTLLCFVWNSFEKFHISFVWRYNIVWLRASPMILAQTCLNVFQRSCKFPLRRVWCKPWIDPTHPMQPLCAKISHHMNWIECSLEKWMDVKI